MDLCGFCTGKCKLYARKYIKKTFSGFPCITEFISTDNYYLEDLSFEVRLHSHETRLCLHET